MPADPEVHDLIVVGSGPAGYTAAIYAARAQLRPVVLEGSVTSGGALMTTTEVENFPGFEDGVAGPDLMARMRKQADRFGACLVPEDAVDLALQGPVKSVTDGSGRTYHARAVVLAMGSGYRRLAVPGEDRLSGHGVSWCATCDGFFFKDKEIAVVGGGDSALEEATFLTRFATKVHVLHRRGELRASKAMQERAFADPKLEFSWHSQVTKILGDQRVEAVAVRDTQTGAARELPVNGVFVAIGHDPRSSLVRSQLDLDPAGYVRVQHPATQTGVDGVFACGDLVDSRYRQAITAAGSGCSAALDAERYLATTPS
ncbi:thioredoxin-disulfide reductase [Amycolatopsis jejuensis]|uniref:thioredoxin-disulfide reductase n=1 Tax=Amycolatopsis jejuensis TaxID=330084 RepID=UPI000527A15A|nr:thioredoxin-disulfide reductase [Amycolatopsis jejuensis]